MRRARAREVVDVQGTAPRRSCPLGAAGAFAIAGTVLGTLDAGLLRVVPLEGRGAEASIACAGSELAGFRGRTATAIAVGPRARTIAFDGSKLAVVAEAFGAERWIPLQGRAVLAVEPDQLTKVSAGLVLWFVGVF